MLSCHDRSKIVVEKDWIVVIAGGSNNKLAKLNSIFRTIDQVWLKNYLLLDPCSCCLYNIILMFGEVQLTPLLFILMCPRSA